MGIKHTTQATGTNDAAKQVSVTAWNEAHTVDTSLNFPSAAYDDTLPAPPSTAGVELYSMQVLDEWRMLGFVNADLKVEYMCPHPARANFMKLIAGGGTTNVTYAIPLGHLITTTGNTFTVQGPTAGTDLSLSMRYRVASTGTAGNTVDIRPTSFIGSRTGGFFFSTTFGLRTTGTANGSFLGVIDTTAALGATTNIVTGTTQNKIGCGINLPTGNWKLIHNTAGTAPTSIDLGTSFAVNTTSTYKLTLFCTNLDTTTVFWRVENLDTGVASSGTATTNLPAVTALLAPRQWLSNNATAVAVALESTGYYAQGYTV